MANPSSTLTAVGVIENQATALYGRVNGADFSVGGAGDPIPSQSILIKYTYLGDALLAGNVQFADFLIWKNAFSENLSGGHLAGWQNAQFDYSEGQTTFADFLIWKNAFSKTLAGTLPPLRSQSVANVSSPTAVPEPSAITLALIGLLGFSGRSTARRIGTKRVG